MITPVNKHLLIKPVEHTTFIATQSETYEEIGEVLEFDININGIQVYDGGTTPQRGKVEIGDMIYFDAWLAAKFPGEKDGEYYWLVKWDDVRAVDHAK